jgi:hypothetical protein
METDYRKKFSHWYFTVKEVIEPERPENIASKIQTKSYGNKEWIDLPQCIDDVARGNLRKEDENKKKCDNNRDDYYLRVPVYTGK